MIFFLIDKCCQFLKLLNSVVSRETFSKIYTCTYICVCMCIYLDICIIRPMAFNFGEMKIFVLLGLLGHLHDASEQECGCDVPSREVYFLFFFFLSSKLDRKVFRNVNMLE